MSGARVLCLLHQRARSAALSFLLATPAIACGLAPLGCSPRPTHVAASPARTLTGEDAAPTARDRGQHGQHGGDAQRGGDGQEVDAPQRGPVGAEAPGEVAADGDEDEEPDDAFDDEEPATPHGAVRPPHPFAALSDAELERRLTETPASLGSMSIGKPSAGLLFNGVAMPGGEAWTVVSTAQAWATEETVRYLQVAIRAVWGAFPGSPRLAVGDLSARGGGYLKPHLSHQSGRDVDLGYYYLDGEHWYARATERNLDLPRTWALVRALVASTDVELILIDHSVQALLRAEAEREGEDPDFLDGLFRGGGGLSPMIRHAPGHATHVHVRFYNPVAQETGRRLYPALVKHHKIAVGPAFAMHLAKKGDTLLSLAKRYGTTPRAIRRANGLKSTKIQARKTYKIPQPGRAPPTSTPRPVVVPPRRTPPPRSRDASASAPPVTAPDGASKGP